MSQTPSTDELLDQVLTLCRDTDTYAAIELLAAQPPADAAVVYKKAQSALYWKARDVPAMIPLSRAGIQHGLTAAPLAADPADATKIWHNAKAMAFDLASFTWPGWDEPGIPLTASDCAVGLDAARLNLRLAFSLDRPDRGKANAHWILGAHQLITGEFDRAVESFQAAQPYAVSGADPLLEQMLQGYILLARVLKNRNDAAARAAFDTAVAALAANPTDDAQAYASQLTTALAAL
jgi:hypothetical protein